MGHRLLIVAAMLLCVAGCRACGSGCYDYLPPVAEGPYTNHSGRAGSAFGNSGSYGVDELPDPAAEEMQQANDSDHAED